MAKAVKIWLIIAGALVALGLIVVFIALLKGGFDPSALSNKKFETNTVTFDSKEASIVEKIDIDTQTADIVFARSESEDIRVDCYEEENQRHKVTLSGGTLSITSNDQRKNWFDYISFFSFSTPKITVYLPQKEDSAPSYTLTINESTGDIDLPDDLSFDTVDINATTGDVRCFSPIADHAEIKLSTGDITFESPLVHSLDLTATTGDIAVSDVTCDGDININATTGDIELQNVRCRGNIFCEGSTGRTALKDTDAAGGMTLKRSTGDILFDHSDAGELFVTTTTGSVRGTLLTEKIFFAETSVGSVDVPKTTSGGRCEITTTTGSIDIRIEP